MNDGCQDKLPASERVLTHKQAVAIALRDSAEREAASQRPLVIQRRQLYAESAEGVLADLAAAGFPGLESVGDLRRSGQKYLAAVPVLLDWLPRARYLLLAEDIVRTLSVSFAKKLVQQAFLRFFREPPFVEDPIRPKTSKPAQEHLRWVIGNGLGIFAGPPLADELIGLALARKFSEARTQIVVALPKTKDGRVPDVLLSLLDDPTVSAFAIQALGKMRVAVGFLGRLVGDNRVAADREAIDQLVAVCGSLPLALRIAGAKLAARPSWPVSAMVRRLTGEHGGLRGLEAGELSVRASIASSYASLSARSRRAFRLLALLGPADFPEWVIGPLLGELDAADVLDELADRSLLTPLDIGDSEDPRYRLHDLLRDYASERLAEEPRTDVDEALGRLFQGWLQLAQIADAQLPPESYFPRLVPRPATEIVPAVEAKRLAANPITWFTTERLNLLVVTGQACRTERLDLARSLAIAQCRFHHLEDRHDDAERVWSSIAETARQSPFTDLVSYAELRIGASLLERGRAADAMQVLDQSVVTAEGMGHPEILALALYWRGACAFDLDDFEQARADTERGAYIAKKAESLLGELLNLRTQANALARLGNANDAVAVSERAVAIATAIGVSSCELVAMQTLAWTCTLTGQHSRAVSICAKVRKLSKQLGNERIEALSLAMQGESYQEQGQHEQAISLLLSALPMFREHHAHRYHAVCLLKLGRSYRELGAYPEAAACLEESLLTFRRLRLPRMVERASELFATLPCTASADG